MVKSVVVLTKEMYDAQPDTKTSDNILYVIPSSERISAILNGVDLPPVIECEPTVDPVGNVYYIDFNDGLDTNDGMTEYTPWKHAPGDLNATDEPLTVELKAGDTFIFRGGVEYRGNIRLKASGNETKDITYKGTGWGSSPAIISGSEILDVIWTQCTSADEVNGNPQFAHIYKATVSEPQDFFSTLYQGDNQYYFSQYPIQPDPFLFNDTGNFISRTLPDTRYEATLSSIRDDDYFTQPEGYWDEAYVTIWVYPNFCVTQKVTGYDPTTHTIMFEPITENTLYIDVLKYSMMNQTVFIDNMGAYAYNKKTSTIYLWPYDPSFATPVTVAKRPVAFNINGQSYVTIDGFSVKEFVGLIKGYHQGIAVYSINPSVKNITVRNNRIFNMRSLEGAPEIDFIYGDHIRILENDIRNVQMASGIGGTVQNSLIRGNTIDRARQGLAMIGTLTNPCNNLHILGNKITNIYDIHGNGISLYNNIANCLVESNFIYGANRPMTMHGYYTPNIVNNFIIYNNIFVAKGEDAVAALTDWGSQLNGVKILNNLILSDYKLGLTLHYDAANVVVKDNIIDGFAVTKISASKPEYNFKTLAAKGWEFAGNIYTKKSWMQAKTTYGWTLGLEEFFRSFDEVVKVSGEDYTILPSSLGAGPTQGELNLEDIGFEPII